MVGFTFTKDRSPLDSLRSIIGYIPSSEFEGFEDAANALAFHEDNETEGTARFGVSVEGEPYTIEYLGDPDYGRIGSILGSDDDIKVRITHNESGESTTETYHFSSQRELDYAMRAAATVVHNRVR